MNILILAIIIVAAVVGLLLILSPRGPFYREVGPNRALIVFGPRGTRVVVGAGTLVLPVVHRADEFDLGPMSFDVAPGYGLYTNQGILVTVETSTQLKVDNDVKTIRCAATMVLSRPEAEREMMVRQVIQARPRSVVGRLIVEQLVEDRELVSARMGEAAAADLEQMDLAMVSFTLKNVSAGSGYRQNMSRPEIAGDTQVAAAATARNATMRQADTQEAAQAQRDGDLSA